jgi:hypothetical protein
MKLHTPALLEMARTAGILDVADIYTDGLASSNRHWWDFYRNCSQDMPVT